jgi:xanthine/CO dehydrogenase XdhC/CoxF family maturation factor
VYSPIGLDIGAETPEEIAISIAAELVQVRAKNSVFSKNEAEGMRRRRYTKKG